MLKFHTQRLRLNLDLENQHLFYYTKGNLNRPEGHAKGYTEQDSLTGATLLATGHLSDQFMVWSL